METTTEERVPLERQTFEHNGLTYVYDFNLLEVAQAEIVKEIIDFKYYQIQNQPLSFRDVQNSGTINYFTTCLSFLLKQVNKDNSIKAFDRTHAETDAYSFVKSLPVTEYKRLQDCITDFFFNIGLSSVGLAVLQGTSRHVKMQTLFNLMKNQNIANSSQLQKKSQSSTKRMPSKKQ